LLASVRSSSAVSACDADSSPPAPPAWDLDLLVVLSFIWISSSPPRAAVLAFSSGMSSSGFSVSPPSLVCV